MPRYETVNRKKSADYKLIPYALGELLKAVYVEAPYKSSGKRKQEIHIDYDLVGFIPVEELINAKEA
ncbi:MAG: DUF4368 domain-containing protein [Clostridiales bacterium]|nr:DUF4368 domain-containing protein [Clostridiales bacterium]